MAELKAGRWSLRRLRIAWVLTVLGLFLAGVAALFIVDDRFYRLSDLQPWATLGCWTASFVVLVSFADRLAHHRTLLWMFVATLLGIVTFPLWLVVFLGSMSEHHDNTTTVAVQDSPDGRVQAVTEKYYNVIDPSCRVWLREPDGLFARRVLVWRQVESGCPRVWFPDNTTISFAYGADNPPMTTTFDPDRMQVAETFDP
ncbi:hypothetical protein [Nocardia sp. NPDC057668]|uniref:hypothetical protein n=1 Tax=Nocardia sp. NPDC057668 TaxID=3346202 RepID=UPI00366BB3E8